VPGGENFPVDSYEWSRRVAAELELDCAQVAAVFRLMGTRTKAILAKALPCQHFDNLTGTDLPLAFVDWVIQHEWVHSLGDLVERRLGLVFDARLSLQTLEALADRLMDAGRLSPASRNWTHLRQSSPESRNNVETTASFSPGDAFDGLAGIRYTPSA
jgi:glycerol-3-phosphate dehydrogenase